MRKLIQIFLIALSFLIIPFFNLRAEGASLNLSPNSGTFYVGSTFDVSVFVNTGGNNINAVQVDLKFDPKKIQVASPTAGRSFISVWISQPTFSNTEGKMSFKGGIPSPGMNTSSGLVSTVTFRAIAPGETNITFLPTSRVLLDDGKGTNVLTSTGRGVYTLTIPPPEGPEVFSPTHPDQNKWYKNNNPTFSWVKEEGVNDFSYNLDHDPQGVPDNNPEGDVASVSYSDLEDGIWYFHVKAKKNQIWGGTSHYLVQIDYTPPASFTPEVSPSDKTIVSQPIVSFITTDALSGFDHFEIKTINVTPGREEKETAFFIEVNSPYKLSTLIVGKYLIVVRSFDKAGNWRDESVQLEIFPSGFSITKEGVFLFGIFLLWWVIALIILLIIIFIIGILIYHWKKQKKIQEEIKQRLKEREEKLREGEQLKEIK